MIGQTLGNYRIVERIGEGGMGSVYRAVDEMLDREVAIKVLRPDLARQAALVERFREEARALARLGHHRIATLHGMERHGDDLLMIMEFVRGDTLEAIVQRTGRIGWTRAAELCVAVLDALDHAHDKRIVHRDIKPANVMLSHGGAVKVMDFGIARMLGSSRQTRAGHSVGTPAYMAPEQLRGEEVDRRTDLYAVGAMLFELVTGRVAFEAESDYRLMMMQLNEPPPPPSTLVPDVPPSIDAIVARAMAKQREDRYPDAGAFADALRAAIAAAPAPALRLVPTPATRLEAPSAPSAPSAPRETASRPIAPTSRDPVATRLAGAPAASVAATRLADAVPNETAEYPGAAAGGRHAWRRDWRVWTGAGVGLVAAGLLAISLRDDPPPPERHTADSTVVDTTRPQVALEPPAPRGEDARSLIINPPATTGAPPAAVDRPVDVPPATPPADAPAEPTTRTRPPARAERRDTRTPPPAPPTTRVVRAVETPSVEAAPERESRAAPAESESEARAGILASLGEAARQLSGRDAGEASLLGGDAPAWGALMKEGRVSLAIDGAPSVERSGDRATATFDATVNVRSPFGANRKRPARFSAELQRSGARWVVRSVRPLGALTLQ